MQQPRYKFYATLLDSFWDYLNSDVVWEKYWGWSEDPPHTQEEFHELQFHSLIDKINRVPFDSEAADKGTSFNEIVDCMVEHRKSDKMQIERVYKQIVEGDVNGDPDERWADVEFTDEIIGLKATYNDREFVFPIELCREFADYFKGALTQRYVEATVNTSFGDVLVYGFIDELMPLSVHDIKTTGSYSVGKFKSHHQHLVYPYCLMQKGSDVRTFEYNIAELNKYNKCVGTYTETYVFEPERDVPILRDHCEQLIQFLEENKDLITDKKVFGLV